MTSPGGRRRRAAYGLLLTAGVAAVLALVPGCTGDGGTREEPPAGLALPTPAQVDQIRADKDAEYRNHPDSPIPADRRAAFKALEYYPFAADWQYRVRLRRYPGGLPFSLTTTGGKVRPAQKIGYVEFERDGQAARLQVYQLSDLAESAKDELFLPFLDETSGVETYGAGRYVELAPGPDGWYVLDFNLAYHPLCAYGRTDYVCPRTPEENRLPFKVAAGERGWAHR